MDLARLDPLEQTILRLRAGGATKTEVGRQLELGRDEVDGHLAAILAKLGARSELQAVAALPGS
jgi:DNA-binding CsgD family transcriptional regulator